MEIDVNTILEGLKIVAVALTGIVTGASVFLKWIAPKTKTLLDDKAYEILIKILRWISIGERIRDKVDIGIKEIKNK